MQCRFHVCNNVWTSSVSNWQITTTDLSSCSRHRPTVWTLPMWWQKIPLHISWSKTALSVWKPWLGHDSASKPKRTPKSFPCRKHVYDYALETAAMMKLFTLHWFLIITYYHISFVGTPIVVKYQFLLAGCWFNLYHIAQIGTPGDKASILNIWRLQFFSLSWNSFISTIHCVYEDIWYWYR